jgi:hypothetical protein
MRVTAVECTCKDKCQGHKGWKIENLGKGKVIQSSISPIKDNINGN